MTQAWPRRHFPPLPLPRRQITSRTLPCRLNRDSRLLFSWGFFTAQSIFDRYRVWLGGKLGCGLIFDETSVMACSALLASAENKLVVPTSVPSLAHLRKGMFFPPARFCFILRLFVVLVGLTTCLHQTQVCSRLTSGVKNSNKSLIKPTTYDPPSHREIVCGYCDGSV